jgi:hypothetical protein
MRMTATSMPALFLLLCHNQPTIKMTVVLRVVKGVVTPAISEEYDCSDSIGSDRNNNNNNNRIEATARTVVVPIVALAPILTVVRTCRRNATTSTTAGMRTATATPTGKGGQRQLGQHGRDH